MMAKTAVQQTPLIHLNSTASTRDGNYRFLHDISILCLLSDFPSRRVWKPGLAPKEVSIAKFSGASRQKMSPKVPI